MPLDTNFPDSTTPQETPEQPDTAMNPGQLPLPTEGINSLSSWRGRIEAAQSVVDEKKPEWDQNQKRYKLEFTGNLKNSDVIVPDDFTLVEQKKAIFLASIDQRVSVEPKIPGLDGAAPIFEAVINHYLSNDADECVNYLAAADECLSDMFCAAGIFGVEIGYIPTVDGLKQVQQGTQPDPNFAPSIREQILAKVQGQPLVAPQVPRMVSVPNIIAEKYFFDRFSPANLLVPKGFSGSDYDRASWIGIRFELDLEIGKRMFNLPDDFKGSSSKPIGRLGHTDADGDGYGERDAKVTGTKIYYTAAVFDPSVKHPKLQRQLILVDGLDHPAVHRDSPYQEQNPDGTLGGMSGYPIHVGSLRYTSDEAYPKSDSSMTKYQVEEKSRARTAYQRQRERNVPQRLVSLKDVGGTDGLAKLEKNTWQAFIPVPELSPELEIIRPIPMTHIPQENFQFDAIASGDEAKAWAISENQTGATTDTVRSASETQAVQQGSGTRMNKEIKKFKLWAEKGIQKLASLIQMFADAPQIVRITGPGGVQQYQTWDRHAIQGTFAFKISVDPVQDRNEFIQMYNVVAPSPNVNRLELDTELVRKYGLPVEKIIQPPQPPAPPVEKPKITVTIDKEALSPNNPAFPIFVEILKSQGTPLSDGAILHAQRAAAVVAGLGTPPVAGVDPQQPGPPDPLGDSGTPPQSQTTPAQNPDNPNSTGTVTHAEQLNKHQQDRTGELTGPKVGPKSVAG